MAYQARIHIAELQGTRNTSRRCAWLSASGHPVRTAGMAIPASMEAGLDSKQAALGGNAI